MASKKHPQQRSTKDREPPHDTRSTDRPTEVSPALSNDGPELVRDTHC